MSEEDTVSIFYATDIYTFCPHCGERITGYFTNPSGTEEDCDHCGKKFKIASHIDIEMQ